MQLLLYTDEINRTKLSNSLIKNNDFSVLWISAVDRKSYDLLTTHFHHHTFFEIHFITEGSITYGFRDKQISVDNGEFIVIPPKTDHKVSGCSLNFSKFTIAVYAEDNSLFSIMLAEKFNCKLETNQMLFPILSDINDTAKSKTILKCELLLLKIYECIYTIQMLYGKKADRCSAQDYDIDTRLMKAKKYIDDNSDIFFSCEEVANHCHISAKHLDRLFKKYDGISLQKYIQTKKLSDAKRLLQDTCKTQAEIAEELGFSGVQYFNKFFKRVTGLTPNEFRNIPK